ncbi:hypothetical protein [Pseudomonas sp. PA15(2017)]|uniref:hypothetical protein n=1 Tax=Pseudomonas sp. PA15(2017) TaxID=1932111 RepID=UPI00117AB6CC|nr:hypothetical protein [Pseudomonas sp. PA15(2017)]
MEFKFPSKIDGYQPEVVRTLVNVEDAASRHAALGLHHPADIFLFAFTDALKSIERLAINLKIETRKKCESPEYKIDLDDFRIDIFNMLFFTNNFIEACQSVIRSIFSEDEKSKFTKASRAFSAATSDIRAHTSAIVNEIKHKHRVIRPFTFSSPAGVIIGYYIEGIVAENCTGPDPLIHQRFEDVYTGFSLNQQLSFHLFSLYKVAACLESTVRAHRNVKPAETMESHKDIALDCLRAVSEIPLMLLPDEFNKDYATVVEKKPGHFTISNPSRKKPENPQRAHAQISLSTTVGIKARSFTMPYFIPRT